MPVKPSRKADRDRRQARLWRQAKHYRLHTRPTGLPSGATMADYRDLGVIPHRVAACLLYHPADKTISAAYHNSLGVAAGSIWRTNTAWEYWPRVREWQLEISPWPVHSFPARSEGEHPPPDLPVGIAPQQARQRCLQAVAEAGRRRKGDNWSLTQPEIPSSASGVNAINCTIQSSITTLGGRFTRGPTT